MQAVVLTTAFADQDLQALPMAKLQIASLLRNLWDGDICVVRSGDSPIFKVERRAVLEIWPGDSDPEVDLDEGRDCPWRWADLLAEFEVEWIVGLAPGSLCLRAIDHLLVEEADILWAPVSGVPLEDASACGYFSAEELEAPVSFCRPGLESASAGVWAVRVGHFQTVCD